MKKICLSIILGAVFTISQVTASSVVQLTPPKISSQTILDKSSCTRPMRKGKFNISIEEKKNKILVHCYGMGGSGWTTLFGSVNKAIALLEKNYDARKVPIHVIGGGCLGLQSAIALKHLGYNVSSITAERLYDLPSWTAAGYFALVSVKTSPEEQANLDAIGIDTFKTYQAIEEGNHPYFTSDCVRFMPVYCSEETESGLENLEACGLIPSREYVTLDFGNGMLHPNFVKYMTYFMNTTKLMQQMHKQVQQLGIPIKIGKINSFDEIEEGVIFNCAGLGAKELNKDDQMIAVRGHLVLLNEKSGEEHMNYMIYTKVKQDGCDEYIYMFPKNKAVNSMYQNGRSCVSCLGGTFIPDTDQLTNEEIEELDHMEFLKMLDRNSIFFHGSPYNAQ